VTRKKSIQVVSRPLRGRNRMAGFSIVMGHIKHGGLLFGFALFVFACAPQKTLSLDSADTSPSPPGSSVVPGDSMVFSSSKTWTGGTVREWVAGPNGFVCTTREPELASDSDKVAPGAETCTSDLWLLTHYSVEDLVRDGLPKDCCVQGLLPEEESWRCELDWPSSDVPPCTIWTDFHRELSNAHSEKSCSDRVKNNLSILARWGAEHHLCSPE